MDVDGASNGEGRNENGQDDEGLCGMLFGTMLNGTFMLTGAFILQIKIKSFPVFLKITFQLFLIN